MASRCPPLPEPYAMRPRMMQPRTPGRRHRHNYPRCTILHIRRRAVPSIENLRAPPVRHRPAGSYIASRASDNRYPWERPSLSKPSTDRRHYRRSKSRPCPDSTRSSRAIPRRRSRPWRPPEEVESRRGSVRRSIRWIRRPDGCRVFHRNTNRGCWESSTRRGPRLGRGSRRWCRTFQFRCRLARLGRNRTSQ